MGTANHSTRNLLRPETERWISHVTTLTFLQWGDKSFRLPAYQTDPGKFRTLNSSIIITITSLVAKEAQDISYHSKDSLLDKITIS